MTDEQREKLRQLLRMKERMAELEHLKASLTNDSEIIVQYNDTIDTVCSIDRLHAWQPNGR